MTTKNNSTFYMCVEYVAKYWEKKCSYLLDTAAIWKMRRQQICSSGLCVHFKLNCFDWGPSGGHGPTRGMASSFTRFLDHTQRRITVGRTPLDGWSARRRDLYMTAHNTHNRKTSMLAAGFEPVTPGSERPQTYALDRTATGIGVRSG